MVKKPQVMMLVKDSVTGSDVLVPSPFPITKFLIGDMVTHTKNPNVVGKIASINVSVYSDDVADLYYELHNDKSWYVESELEKVLLLQK